MPDLREQLDRCLQGRVCLIGIGNVELGDDGFGVRLAESLLDLSTPPSASGSLRVLIAGTIPERYIGHAQEGGLDHLVFLDAVDFGAAPGAAVLMEGDEIVSRFPQVSTHRISLGLLALWAENTGATKAWLLGVQPGSLSLGRALTPAMQASLGVLQAVLRSALGRGSHPPSRQTGAVITSPPSAVMR